MYIYIYIYIYIYVCIYIYYMSCVMFSPSYFFFFLLLFLLLLFYFIIFVVVINYFINLKLRVCLEGEGAGGWDGSPVTASWRE